MNILYCMVFYFSPFKIQEVIIGLCYSNWYFFIISTARQPQTLILLIGTLKSKWNIINNYFWATEIIIPGKLKWVICN